MTSGAGPRAGGVNDNERHLHHSPVSSPTEELRKDKRMREDQSLNVFCVLCAAVIREGLPRLFCV